MPFLLVCLGFFATPYLWRSTLLPGNFAVYNLLAWAGIILIMGQYYRGLTLRLARPGRTGSSNPLWVIGLLAAFVACCLTIRSLNMMNMVKYAYALVCPLFLLYVSVPDEDAVLYFRMFTNALTIVCSIIFLCGLADLACGGAISRAIAGFTGVESLFSMCREGRMVSYMGHPLLTTELMLLCFLFNTINSYYLKKEESFWYVVYYSLVSVAGIGMCGGKTGIVLIAAAFVLLYVNKKRVKYIFFVLAAVLGAYAAGLLDTVIGRLAASLAAGDLTTGRNAALLLLLARRQLNFRFFGGNAGSEMTTELTAALEYPPLRWAYMFGIWFSVVMCLYLFLPPVIRALKAKNSRILIVMAVFMLDVNTYNGLAVQGDYMLLYCVVMFLLLNLLRVLEGPAYENVRNRAKPVYSGRRPAGGDHHPEPAGGAARV